MVKKLQTKKLMSKQWFMKTNEKKQIKFFLFLLT